ncbi:MAG: hypothetical protein RLZZ507_94 [Cyanobacteriota bacterium]|jgi:hypothetical protein
MASNTSPSDLSEKYQLTFITGEAQGTTTWSETHVSGSGYSHVYQGTGSGSMHVSSKVNTRHRFYLIADNGGEVEMDTTGLDFNVRDSHRVTGVWCRELNDKENKLIFLYNYNTGIKVIPKNYRSLLEVNKSNPKVVAACLLAVCELIVIPLSFVIASLAVRPLIFLLSFVLQIPVISWLLMAIIALISLGITATIAFIASRFLWYKIIQYLINSKRNHNEVCEWITNSIDNHINTEIIRVNQNQPE